MKGLVYVDPGIVVLRPLLPVVSVLEVAVRDALKKITETNHLLYKTFRKKAPNVNFYLKGEDIYYTTWW